MKMCGIRISVCCLFIACANIAFSQSCSLACAESECGMLNVAFTPQGGPDFCEGTLITFSNASEPGFDFFVIDWSDGTKDTVTHYNPVTHAYSIADSNLCDGNIIFEVCFRGVKECSAGISCSSGSYDFKLKVRPKALINIAVQHCIESPVQFINASCNDKTYFWEFGDGQTSTSDNPSHTYNSPGSYTVTLTVTNDCGSDAVTQSIQVVEDPITEVNWTPADDTVCINQIFAFQDITNQFGTNTVWSIVPNDTSRWMFTDTLMNFNSDLIEVIFKETGNYTVRLTANNRCGTNVWEEVITVLEGPEVMLTNGPQLCISDPTYDPHATYMGQIISYNWQFPGGTPSSSTLPNPGIVTYTTPGQHEVTLTIMSECGEIESTTTVIVDALPVITMPPPQGIYCTGSSPDTLIATPAGGVWSGPGINNMGVFNPAIAGPGNHTLTYTVVNGECMASGSLTVTVVNSETVTVEDEQFCEDASAFLLIASPTGGTWTGIGITSPMGTFDPLISGVGTFAPVYHYSDINNCMIDIAATVIIQPFPQVSMLDTSLLCNENIQNSLAVALQLTLNPQGGIQQWTFNGMPSDGTINGSGLLGFYSVGLTYTFQACTVTDSAVTEFISAIPLLVSNDTSLCIYDNTYALQANLSGTWSGPGVNPNTGIIDLSVPGAGNFTFTFVHQPGTSCEQTANVQISISDPGLLLNAGPDVSLCENQVLQYTFSGASPGGGSWSGHGIIDSILGTLNVSALLLDSVYSYSYCLDDVSIPGCRACDLVTLIVHALPATNFSIAGNPCQDIPFSVTTDTCITGYAYAWNFGNGNQATGCNVDYTYTIAGDYNLQLTVTANTGCSNTGTINVHVTAPPMAAFALLDDEGCAPFSVEVSNLSTGEITQYQWLFGADTLNGFNPGPIIIDGLHSDSTIQVILQAINGCATSIVEDSVLVHPYPVVNIGLSIDEGCSPLLVDFGNATVGNPENWLWDLGNGMTSTDSVPSVQVYSTSPDSISIYTVQLISSNACGADTGYQTITVYPPDVNAFIQLDTLGGCQPLLVTAHSISTPGGIVGWQVMHMDTIVTGSILNDPTFILDQPGLHTILLTVSRCGSDMDTAYVEVLPAPEVDFIVAPVLCEDELLHFENTSVDVNGVMWDFGDGNFSSVFSPDHQYISGGTYQVSLLAYSAAHNCPDTQTVSIVIHPRPVLDIDTQPISGCPPLTVSFQHNSPGNIDYVWNFNDGTPQDTSVTPVHTFITSGSYITNVFARDIFGCVSDTTLIPVEIFPVPISAFDIISQRFCERLDSVLTINQSTGATSFIWSINNVPFAPDPLAFLPAQAGTYTIELIAENAFSCRDTAREQVNILATPNAQFSAQDTAGCAPLVTTMTNSSDGSTDFIWDFGDGNTSTDIEPTHHFIQDGFYTITLIATQTNGCPNDTAIAQVNVFPVPESAFTFAKSDICGAPMDVTFSNQSIGGLDYGWTFGDGQQSDLLSPTHTFSQAGIYQAQLIAGNMYSCFDTSFAFIPIYEQPIADFEIAENILCAGSPIEVTNLSLHGNSFCWLLDGQLTSEEEFLIFSISDPGTYTLALIAKYNAVCVDTYTLATPVQVFVAPSADYSFEVDVQENTLGDVQYYHLAERFDRLQWDFGDGLSSNELNPLHEYNINRNILATLYAFHDNGGIITCVDSISKEIAPEWLVTFFAPNAFSPDHGDSLVRLFKPVGIGLADYNISVYSPWGQRVWQSTAIVDQMPLEGWNGRLDNNGEALPQGAFTWMARVEFVNGDRRVYKGSVTLLR